MKLAYIGKIILPCLWPPFAEGFFNSLKLKLDSMRFMLHVKFIIQYGNYIELRLGDIRVLLIPSEDRFS